MLLKLSSLIAFLLIFYSEGSMAEDILSTIRTCPDSPNCVSSLTESKKHFMPPWIFNGELSAVKETVKEKLLSLKRVKLISETENSLHFVFTSFLMRYKDDVWFYFDAEESKVHFKSASRVGYSDLGANSKRMKGLKKLIF